MSKETEKVLRDLHKYLDKKGIDNEEDLQKEIDKFMKRYNDNLPKQKAADSWDYLDLAYDADSEEDALKYAKKALQLDKNCLDAEVMITELTTGDNEELKRKYEKMIEKTEKYLRQANLLNDENAGHFWGIVETRPYMRLRYSYVKLLLDQGKFRKAIKECEDLLLLSESDNLGVRYILISLYAFFEDEINVIRLHKKFNEEESSHMLLPIVALYYKLDNYKKAGLYLKKFAKANDELKEFFCNTESLDEIELDEVINSGTYRAGSKEEIMIAMAESSFLYTTTAGLFLWIAEKAARF